MTQTRHILKVAELNNLAKDCLEAQFASVWVEGEISNLARPASGHLYFSLKDERAQVRCAIFKGAGQKINCRLDNGLQVLARARVTLYAPRGDYQLIIESIEPAGDGKLQQAFEQLKQKLFKEGLFAAEHKQELPEFVRHLGVITSPSAAALRDILHVLQRRFPGLPVTIYPTQVQGEPAAKQIVQAINLAIEHGVADVLIIARGGGSLEDLWPFNEEIVARAIYACPIPIVSGIGHEIDYTIADFVADVRAPTPSAAAELVSTNAEELIYYFADLRARLIRIMQQKIAQHKLLLQQFHKRLKHPGRQVEEWQQRIDEFERRFIYAWNARLQQWRDQCQLRHKSLLHLAPSQRINQLVLDVDKLHTRLLQSMQTRLLVSQDRLSHSSAQLNALSPLATLERGYAVVRTLSGQVVRSVTELEIGQKIMTRLVDGQVGSVVQVIDAGGS